MHFGTKKLENLVFAQAWLGMRLHALNFNQVLVFHISAYKYASTTKLLSTLYVAHLVEWEEFDL